MSSCFGLRKARGEDTEALLPQYADDTSLQRTVHQKMHSYQMIRALTKGYMPSTEQLIINLRTLLASDILNPDNPDLSDSGRLLVKYSKQWLAEFIELLRHKNENDQIQDFIWFLSNSKISLDTGHLAKTASNVKAKADTTAGRLYIHHRNLIWLIDRSSSLREPTHRWQPPSDQFRLPTLSWRFGNYWPSSICRHCVLIIWRRRRGW